MASSSPDASRRVMAEVQEFDRLAGMLGMPKSECRSILGVTEKGYGAWQAGVIDMEAPIAPEFIRRLAYALPLMRRMVANQPMLPPGRGQNPAQSSVN